MVQTSGGAAAVSSSPLVVACSSGGSSSLPSFPDKEPWRPKPARAQRGKADSPLSPRFPKFVRRGLKSNVSSVEEDDVSNPFLDLLNDKFPPFRPKWDRVDSIEQARERQEAGWYA